MVYMDFDQACSKEVMGLNTYHYEPLPIDWLPPLYVAYHTNLGEPTEHFHDDIRGRFNRGEHAGCGSYEAFRRTGRARA